MEVPNSYQAFFMSKVAPAKLAKPYDPNLGEEAYGKPTYQRKEKYDGSFKGREGEDADPSSQDFDPFLVMVSGGGKRHGRPSVGASAFPVETESLPAIKARATSSSLPILTRDEPARDLAGVSFVTHFLSFLHVFVLTTANHVT